jgi:hypothetical protein
MDGLAIKVKVRRDDTQHVLSFYSGSKHCYCVNFQGVCDSNRRFIGVSCKFTGSTKWMLLSPVTCIHGIKCYHFHFIGIQMVLTHDACPRRELTYYRSCR